VVTVCSADFQKQNPSFDPLDDGLNEEEKREHGLVAQLDEHLICIQEDEGSNPFRSTMYYELKIVLV